MYGGTGEYPPRNDAAPSATYGGTSGSGTPMKVNTGNDVDI